MLVCAQSNAAVDELVERLGTQGLFAVSSNGQPRRIPAMVRMGKMESATSTAQWFQIDAVAAANDEHVGDAQGGPFRMLSPHQARCAHLYLQHAFKLHVKHDDHHDNDENQICCDQRSHLMATATDPTTTVKPVVLSSFRWPHCMTHAEIELELQKDHICVLL